MRDKNLNVSLEIGYLLGDRKDDSKIVFLIDEDEKISDLQGMIRISKKENNSKAGKKPAEAAKKQEEINNELKDKIKNEFKSYLT
jgi:predicted nucleotide-binding protein